MKIFGVTIFGKKQDIVVDAIEFVDSLTENELKKLFNNRIKEFEVIENKYLIWLNQKYEFYKDKIFFR